MMNQTITKPLVISLIGHLYLTFMLAFLANYLPKLFERNQRVAPPSIKVEQVSRQRIEKIRQKIRKAGVRGGKKSFSAPLPQGKGKKKKITVKDIGKQNKALDFSKLAPKVKKLKNPAQVKKNQFKNAEFGNARILAKKSALKVKVSEDVKRENIRRQQGLKKDMLKSLAPQSQEADLVENTGFNIHFEPPEGVPLDELNSVEKIYFSFQKRTFVTYVNAFISSYRKSLLSHPRIKEVIKNERHLLTGRVKFDEFGNIVSIKILRSSTNDDLHNLFETTLKDIRKLPNPPKDMIKQSGDFTIYYQLQINGR